MNERAFQYRLVRKLEVLFPGCIVLKNDPRYVQGMPDILILYKNKWAALEVKMSGEANVQPNQEYYINMLNDMSFASFINPENEEDVLDDVQRTFGTLRATRIS